jgi:hypothetical protein
MAKRVEASGRKPTLDTQNAPPPPDLPPPPPQTRAEREAARRLAKQQTRKRPVRAVVPKPVKEPKPAKAAKAPARPQTKLRAVPLRRPMERRYRQTVRSVDLWSVLKISVCFYLCGLIVALGSGIVLWWIASGVGVIDNVENFIGDLLGSEDFEFLSWRILRGATLVGLVVVCLQVVCTVLAAAFYNLFSEMLGGIEMTVVEEEPTGA